MKHIAILTSGGDAPGMNAAIRAVTRSALDQGMTVHGVRQGWQGLVDDQFRQLSARDVGGIIQVGGTFLGSARSAEFREEGGRTKALRNLAQRGIDGVVVIGGDGGETGAGLSGGAEVISTPEFEVSASEIAQRLQAAYQRGKTHAIVVIAEGVKENAA